MRWIGNLSIALGSHLILLITACGTTEGSGNPGFNPNFNSTSKPLFDFCSNAHEQHKESESSNGSTTGPTPLYKLYEAARSRDDHLILTPFIKNNRKKEGVRAAKSLPIPRHKIPVIVWLQGGTGSSSMHGAFRGNGPIRLEDNGSLTYNRYSWAEKAHLVYFDNPVGAGYSYTLKKGFSKNMHEAATNLYTALEQFLTLFRLAKNPLYIASQGFGGKYATSLGAEIHNKRKMKLEGVVIGNGFIDPPNMLRFGAYMYQLGFIDTRVQGKFRAMRRRITNQLRNGNHDGAVELFEQWLKHGGKGTHIGSICGLPSMLNYKMVHPVVNEVKLLNSHFNNQSIMSALNSGVAYTTQNHKCARALRLVMLESQAHNLRLLMSRYRVLLYHGQLSIKNAYPFMLRYLDKIHWRGRKHYKNNRRIPWKVDGEVAGYYRTGGRFTELLIRNAGQLVPLDQPKWALRMINNFIHKLSLNDDDD